MVRQSAIHYLMIFMALGMILAGVFSILLTAEYEIAHKTTTEDLTEIEDEFAEYGAFEYESLSAEQRAMVDGAIGGERYRVDTGNETIGGWGSTIIVTQGETYHLLTRETVYRWTSPFGLLGVLLVVGGVVLIAETVRRRHFSHVVFLERFR